MFRENFKEILLYDVYYTLSSDFVQKHSIRSTFFISALGVGLVIVCQVFNSNHIKTRVK